MSVAPGRRALTLATLVASLALVAACDPAVDARYPGEPLHLFRGRLHALPSSGTVFEDPTLARTLRLAVAWAPAARDAGTAIALVDDTPLVAGTALDFTAGVYLRPPADTLRPLAQGRLALGQVIAWGDRDGDQRKDDDEPMYGASEVLVAFTPEGASDPSLAAPLAAGFHELRPSAPCDAEPVRYFPPPSDTVELDLDLAFDASGLFAASGCVARAAVAGAVCPALATIRWVCRYGPAPVPLCGRCEAQVFPEGAAAEVCAAWFERCVSALGIDPDECAAERDVCLAGEPAPAVPCDLACACDAFREWCVWQGGEPDGCDVKRQACLWR